MLCVIYATILYNVHFKKYIVKFLKNENFKFEECIFLEL